MIYYYLFVPWQDQELIDRFKGKDVNTDAAFDSDFVESEHSDDSDRDDSYAAALQ